MANIKVLDCTFRDGGYYTKWDFDPNLVRTYAESFNQLPVEYLEIGYRSTPQKEYLGEYFYCPKHVLRTLREKSNKKIAIMLNEKDTTPNQGVSLLEPCKGLVDLVRLAIDPQHLGRGIKLAKSVKEIGFEVAFNVMYMSKWKHLPGFLDMLNQVDEVADYLYLVDSYGGVYPQDVKELFQAVKQVTRTPLGFHGHNNLELALVNTLAAIESGAVIVDSTVTGMGRGPGNLKTELLLTVLNSQSGLPVDFDALSTVVHAFEKLQSEHQWGTNLPYMVSGANSLPQKDVMEWVTRRFYSINSIIRALDNQKQNIKDNRKFEVFNPKKGFTTAIVIGGGPNANLHKHAVKDFIERSGKNVCLIHASSKNAAEYRDIKIEQFFCLVGNEGHRLEKVFSGLSNFEGLCILPPFPRKMGTYVPRSVESRCFELHEIKFTDRLHDSHTALALQTCFQLGVTKIFLVGYDGYQGKTITQLEKTLSDENEFLFDAFAKFSGLKLLALTPTNYRNLPVTSIYAYLG